MYLVSNFYLSRIIGRKVYYKKDNSVIGRISDLIVDRDFSRPKLIAVKLRSGIILDTYSLLHDRRLKVKLHPWRNGCADNADGHINVILVAPRRLLRQSNGGVQCFAPTGL